MRRVVLDAWSASPARFREDANAEEALAVGGYAGRVLVELASNAVDAAREHGVPARIRVRWDDGELRLANTGAPLTAAGVAGLSSLRASAKRDTLASVGHFGVGFTAVLSWSTSPRVVSTTGGVAFDRAATAAAIAALSAPALDTEVALRRGSVPALRLPWPTPDSEPPPPDGYATEVRLALLRHAIADMERFLGDPDAAEDLFWALPELTEIDLPDRVVRRRTGDDGLPTLDDGEVQIRYRTARLAGRTPPELLADRPVEERRRAWWWVTWALPTPPGGDTGVDALEVPGDRRGRAGGWTVGAPTPTDEPLTLPARLVGTFPVDDTRRRLAPGALCDFLLERAADAYLDLIAATEPAGRWALLPARGFPAGPVDGTLRQAVLRRLEVTPFLVTAVGDLVSLRTACVLPGLGRTGAELFGQAIPGLLPPQPAGAVDALRTTGVSVLTWSQASAAMAGIERDPGFWWQVYDAVATAERAPGPDDLADLPVPLVGGRRILGARGCLLPTALVPNRGESGTYGRHTAASGTGIEADLARRVGDVIPDLRMVDPAAAHPYLERLGARPADPDALLADPAVAAALVRMREDLEDFDPEPDEVRDLATVVLDLVAAGGRATRVSTSTGAEPLSLNRSSATAALLTELVLTTDDGQPWPASELLMPDADLETVLAGDADRPTIGDEWLAKYSTDVLVAAGVRAGFAVVVMDPAGQSADLVLPGFDRWLDQAEPAPATGPITAVADLDMVDPDRWPQALALIAADREARACILQGVGSYSAWWLSRHARIGGQLPGYWRLADAADLIGLYDPIPIELDASLAKAIGVCGGLADATAADAEGLLDRLADPHRTVPAARVAAVTAAAVTALTGIADLDLPSGVRTLSGSIIDADDAWVLDNPWLAQVVPVSRLVPGGPDPELVARVLDLPLASEHMGAAVVRPAANAGAVGGAAEGIARERLRRAAEAVGFDPRTVVIVSDEQLSVTVDGEEVAVRWWGADGRLLTDGSAEGIGRAVAWAAHCWPSRHLAVGAAAEDHMAVAEDGVDRPPGDQMLSSSAI